MILRFHLRLSAIVGLAVFAACAAAFIVSGFNHSFFLLGLSIGILAGLLGGVFACYLDDRERKALGVS